MTPTPLRNIRIADKLWLAVKKKTIKEGTTITQIVVDAFERYLVSK